MAEKLYRFCDLTKRIKVSDSILEKYISLGEENGVLGYPTANQYTSGGMVQPFQYGYIYHHPEFGTYITRGKIHRHWADNLGVYGKYQYPISDITEVDSGVFSQKFQGGVISTDMAELANKSSLVGEFARRGIGVRHQGGRGTCSVQTMVALLEYAYSGLLGKDFAHLSVEYSNYFASVACGNADDGDFFSSMEKGYDEYGIITDAMWPYNPNFKYDLDECASIVTDAMTDYGRRFISDKVRLNGYFLKAIGGAGLSDEQFDEMIKHLDDGIPLGIGRSHSMTLVAYERGGAFPGGGTFTFRNSYGTTPHFSGYQVETFENVKNTVFDVYVYTNFKNKIYL